MMACSIRGTAVLALVVAAGCATVISGTTQKIGVTSEPAGATVTAEPGGARATTNGWVFGNIIIGGLIGMAVDSSTGASNSLSPDQVSAHLVRLGVDQQSHNGDTVYVFAKSGALLGTLILE